MIGVGIGWVGAGMWIGVGVADIAMSRVVGEATAGAAEDCRLRS